MYTSIYNIVIICADRPRIINDDENKRLYINIFFFIHTCILYIILYCYFFPCPFRLFRRRESNTAACAHAKKKSLPYSSNTTRRSNDYCCCYYYYFTENDVDLRHRRVYRQQYNVRRVCEFGIACFLS